MSRDDPWIEELERDLGQAARLRLLANVGGQRRTVPRPEGAVGSQLAAELGLPTAAWLAERFGGENIDVPSARGREAETRASLLRAAILDAGLDAPSRSANALATEFGVTSTHVRRLRAQLRAERAGDRSSTRSSALRPASSSSPTWRRCRCGRMIPLQGS